MNNEIHEIEGIVEHACSRKTNIFGYGIWTHHISEVARNAKRMAAMFGADPEIVEIAALLHDYASVKDPSLYDDHHIHGPIEAEKVLKNLGFSQDMIEAVKHCIATHRGSRPGERTTAEAECLANADAITHVENVPSLLHFTFVQREMGIDEGTRWLREKLERSWNKMSPQVQEMTREKYEAALLVLAVSKQKSLKHS